VAPRYKVDLTTHVIFTLQAMDDIQQICGVMNHLFHRLWGNHWSWKLHTSLL